MKSKRRIIVYIATSADGYIARSDGDVAWLNRPRPAGNYGMNAFFKSVDTILWGRKTFDMTLGAQGGSSGYAAGFRNYVLTHRTPTPPVPGVEFVQEPIERFAQRLRATSGKNIWMMGGAGIIGAFLDAGELDEFVIHVVPVLIGEGIPLIAPRHRLVKLNLKSSRRFPDGVVRLHYEVGRSQRPAAPDRGRANR
jgi:dihydrofolate reductase